MTPLDKYVADHSTPISDTLKWVEKQTHLKTNHARMLSGHIVGKLLENISLMIRPKAVLELGTFTGYATICLSAGVQEDGTIDTIDINDELEDIIREGFDRAGLSEKINFIIGDAQKVIPTLDKEYDLVYIDANKRHYCEYFNLVIDKVRHGGYIIADNVLWDNKVLAEHPDKDAQTQGIIAFNELAKNDPRVENIILPLRDGLNLIRVK